MAITVRNASRTPFVLNLLSGVDYDHPDLVPTDFAMDRPVVDADGVTQGIEHHRKKIPGSLTWLPGETKRALPSEVAQIEQFKRAVLDGDLVVVEQGTAATSNPATPSNRTSRVARGEGDK